MSLARFCRFNYNSTQTVPDASRYAVIDLGYGSSPTAQAAVRSLIASIKAADPGIELLMYHAPLTILSDPAGIGGVPWTGTYPATTSPVQNDFSIPLSWFLTDSSGNLLQNPPSGGIGQYFLDPGNSNVQSLVAGHVTTQASAAGYTGIFIDVTCAAGLHWLGGSGVAPNPACPSIASDTAWQAAIVSFVTALGSACRAAGLKLYLNIGGAYATAIWQGAWSRYIAAGADGALEESFALGTSGAPVAQSVLNQQLQNLAWSEANSKTTLCNADVLSDGVKNTYGLAAMLLASNGRACWDSASGGYATGEFWFPEYDTALLLGTPSGAYRVTPGGLYVRDFSAGFVALNPTAATITDATYAPGGLGSHLGTINHTGGGGTNPAVGDGLNCSVGLWANSPMSYSFQWQQTDASGGSQVDIAGATNSNYTVQTADVGFCLVCVVTAINVYGNTPAASLPTSLVV